MWGSELLDVAIGVVFVYILMSLAASALSEVVAHLTNMRFQHLKRGISGMVGPALSGKLLDHQLIKSLGKKGKPSFIPGYMFASALIDLAEREPESSKPAADSAFAMIQKLAGNEAAKIAGRIETWFDDVMEQVASWYKRKSQIMLLIYGLLISAALNVDTVALVNRFSADDVLRDEVVSIVEEIAEKESLTEAEKDELAKDGLELLGNAGVFGWRERAPEGFLEWLYKVIGILLTALAVSLGAPFWFDLGNKIVAMRPRPKNSKTSAETGSG